MAKIGFIGLGVMGTPMARHLQNAGHQLFTAKHRRPPNSELTDNGLVVLEDPKSVAAETEIVILMLPDTPDVEGVLFGTNGVADGIRDRKSVV